MTGTNINQFDLEINHFTYQEISKSEAAINSSNKKTLEGEKSSKAISKDNNVGPLPVNPLILALLMIIDSMSIQQTSAQIQCKQLQTNASAQNELNNQEGNFNFKVWSAGMAYTLKKVVTEVSVHGEWSFLTGSKRKKEVVWKKELKSGDPMDSIETLNLQVQKERDGLNNQILLLRQNAQVGQSQLNSSIDQTEQTVQEGSGIMQLISSVTNQITS